jgi:peptidoglycan DL-endopeptidase CwlO
VVAFALAQVGTPYEKGAAGPHAYDCSGLVVAAYRAVGIELPHWSVSQAEAGRAVDWRQEAIRPGDLVFTRGDSPAIDLGHVGIALDGTTWISAPRPGGHVHVVPMPTAAIQRVRRLVDA